MLQELNFTVSRYEFDVVAESPEELVELVAPLGDRGLVVRVATMDGPAGWPVITVDGCPATVRECMRPLGFEEAVLEFDELYRIYGGKGDLR